MVTFADYLFLLLIIGVVVFVIYLVVKDCKNKQIKEEKQNIKVNKFGEKKQICFWCKEEINVGAKLCPHCGKVPTKAGRDNKQIEILIGIVLIILSIMLWF